MARLDLRIALCLVVTLISVGADDLIQLLDELLKSEEAAKSGYNAYSEPVAEYAPAAVQYASYAPPSVSYNQPAASYAPGSVSYIQPVASLTPAVVSYNQPVASYDYVASGTYAEGQSNVDSVGVAKEGYGYAAPQSYMPTNTYQQQQTYESQPPSYGYEQKKPKTKIKKIYIPVVAKKKKKKKMKIITVQKGFFISGGTQLYGKFNSLWACEQACAATPNCFAGDYNPWFKKCYIHSNYTACGTLKAHKYLVHFKKVPCSFPEAPAGRVMLGVQIFKGVEQKKVKSLSECLKCCAMLGMGIQARANEITSQICFGIDYDFGTHKCYFHTNNYYPAAHLCPVDGSPPKVPRDTVPNPSVVSILLCPGPYVKP